MKKLEKIQIRKSNSSVNTSSNSSFGNTTEKAEETKEK